MEKAKQVVVNGRFLVQRVTGINRFAVELCRALKKIFPELIVVIPEWLDYDHHFDLNIVRFGKLKSHFWEQIDLLVFLKKAGGHPLLINFSGLGPLLYRNQIMTIHDLSFMRHPEWFSWSYNLLYKFLTPILAQRCRHIFTVSNFSKDEIIELLKVNSSKITVVYNAVSDHVSMDAADLTPPEKPYILMVSSLDPRKNHERIFAAFNRGGFRGYELKVIGKTAPNFRNAVQASRHRDIFFCGYVSDRELATLYANASLFIYPSLYEGFGIPPLEAMKNGCPTVVSDIPSLREVCGNSTLYVDPYSIDEIITKMKKVLQDEVLRQSLIKAGYERVKRFNWTLSAKKVEKVIGMLTKLDR